MADCTCILKPSTLSLIVSLNVLHSYICLTLHTTQAQTYSRRPVWIALHLGEDEIAGFPISSHAERINELEDEDKQIHTLTHQTVSRCVSSGGVNMRCKHPLESKVHSNMASRDNNNNKKRKSRASNADTACTRVTDTWQSLGAKLTSVHRM